MDAEVCVLPVKGLLVAAWKGLHVRFSFSFLSPEINCLVFVVFSFRGFKNVLMLIVKLETANEDCRTPVWKHTCIRATAFPLTQRIMTGSDWLVGNITYRWLHTNYRHSSNVPTEAQLLLPKLILWQRLITQSVRLLLAWTLWKGSGTSTIEGP